MEQNSRPKQVDVYFDKYAESHQNPKNELIHWICVPLIVFSLVGLMWSIPFPYLNFLGGLNGYVSWAWFLIAFAVYYYFKLSPVLAGFMLLLILVFMYAIIALLNWQHTGGPMLWQSCLAIFVLSWVGQFIGHKIEGKKPSFFDDIKFLLIGPIWLMHFVLMRFGIRY